MDDHRIKLLQLIVSALQQCEMDAKDKAKLAKAILKQACHEAKYCSFIPELIELVSKAIKDEE